MTLLSLHMYRDAEEELRRVREIRRQILGEDHPDTLRSTLQLGHVIWAALDGRAHEAEPFAREALAGMKDRYGPDHRNTLSAQHLLANVLAAQDHVKESYELFKNTVEAQGRVLGEKHRDTLMTRYQWSFWQVWHGNMPEGRKLVNAGYELSRNALEPDDTLAIMYEVLVGAYAALLGPYEEAEQRLRLVHDHCREVLGEGHPFTHIAMKCLAQAVHRQRKYEEAEARHRATWENLKATIGEAHLETVATGQWLALTLCDQGKFQDAVELLREAVRTLVDTRGEVYWNTCLARDILARALRGAGKLDEAKEEFSRMVASGLRLIEHPDASAAWLNYFAWYVLRCDYADLSDIETALHVAEKAAEMSDYEDGSILDTLAVAYQRVGDLEKAVETERRASELLPPGEPADRIDLDTKLIAFLRKAGDIEAAESLQGNIIERARQVHGDKQAELVRRLIELSTLLVNRENYRQHSRLSLELTSALRGEAMRGYAGVAVEIASSGSGLTQERKYAEAEELLRACLEVHELALPEDDWRVAHTMSVLGESLTGQGRFDEAEPLLLDSYEQMKDDPDAPPDRFEDAIRRTADLYEAWGKHEQAAEW